MSAVGVVVSYKIPILVTRVRFPDGAGFFLSFPLLVLLLRLFVVVYFVVPMGFFLMGNSGRLPRGKPPAIESRYPTLFKYYPSVCTVVLYHTTGCEAYSFTTNGHGIFKYYLLIDVFTSLFIYFFLY